ncbi:MAG: hypothetical protein ACK5HY_13610 [Parahaliea sp.]
MAEIAFDTLQYARRLKEAGVPEQQAEVQAELMGQAFGYYVGNLVTKDYLDARFNEYDAHMEARFAQQENRMDALFGKLEAQLKLHNWILALLTAVTLLPTIKNLLQ